MTSMMAPGSLRTSGKVTKKFHYSFHKRGKEPRFGGQLFTCVPHSSPENSPEHISSSDIVRSATVAEGNGQSSGVISEDPVGHVDAISVLFSNFAAIGAHPSTSRDCLE